MRKTASSDINPSTVSMSPAFVADIHVATTSRICASSFAMRVLRRLAHTTRAATASKITERVLGNSCHQVLFPEPRQVRRIPRRESALDERAVEDAERRDVIAIDLRTHIDLNRHAV